MKRSLLAALVVCGGLASSASAQDLGANWTRTFFGCDEMRSCHRVIFDMAPDPDWPDYVSSGTVRWQSWFFIPGIVLVMGVTPFNSLGYEFGGADNVYSWYAEGIDVYNAEGPGWRPEVVGVSLSYGKFGTALGVEDEYMSGLATLRLVHSTTVTPEPASMLLLATGLAAVATRQRRRKRSRLETPA